MVESNGDIASYLDVLSLIVTHWYFVRVVKQDIGSL
jgi:hypothetical protein